MEVQCLASQWQAVRGVTQLTRRLVPRVRCTASLISEREVRRVLHMNGGTGDTSYFNNSSLQKKGIAKVKTILEECAADLYCTNFAKSLGIADLGCSSGPNTLLVISQIIDAIYGKCHHLGHSPPEFRVFLNDLPGNDFNTIFKCWPDFYEKLKQEKGSDFGPCFIMGVPGSFYGRLFPAGSLDFVHSSYSVHWLSQVPPGLQTKTGGPLNKGNIYMDKSSPPAVFKAYLEQFQRDFSLFLRSRSEEMRNGGRLVISIMGRRSPDPTSGECRYFWKLLGDALMDMASEGIIKEADVDSFDMPYYNPSIEEVKAVVETEGSFQVERLEVVELNWDPNDNGEEDNEGFVLDKMATGVNAAKIVRAGTESMMATHFVGVPMDDLYRRYAEHAAELLSEEKIKHVNLIICMTKK